MVFAEFVECIVGKVSSGAEKVYVGLCGDFSIIAERPFLLLHIRKTLLQCRKGEGSRLS